MKRFFRSKAGVAGLVLLSLLVAAGVFGPLAVPYREAATRWRDISYWQDSPSSAPPAWTAWFAPENGAAVRSATLKAGDALFETLDGGGRKVVWQFDLGDIVPQGRRIDVVLTLPGSGMLPVVVALVDADGAEREIARKLAEAAPGKPARLNLSLVAGADGGADGAAHAGAAADEPRLVAAVYLAPGAAPPPAPSLAIIGTVSGLLGTDASKRDIFTGVILGVRWALILGVAVSFLTAITGILLGIGAACYGGWVDALLNRLYEFFSLMPMLPFLIVLSAVYKPSLWSFAALALLFFWTRAFKPVYTMALRIREEGYIEAAKSLGTGRFYRAFKYVLPELLPYGFAIMALSVPGIILYEASVSILGLGDSSVVTWGQMLRDALSQGAVINRLWWWVLPPGLMISLTGIAFSLIGRGLERVWKPGLSASPAASAPKKRGIRYRRIR